MIIILGLLPVEKFKPSTAVSTRQERTNAKWRHIISLCKAQKFKEFEHQYPAIYAIRGHSLKMNYKHQVPCSVAQMPHYWITGKSFAGKSNIVSVLWPQAYVKRGEDKDWVGFNEDVHTTVYMGDVDPAGFQAMGSTSLKTWCDPQGFNANKKFGGGDTQALTQVIVTSNFTIDECFKPGCQGIEKLKDAMQNRFKQVDISDILHTLKIKLKSPEEIEELKQQGNKDFYKTFCNLDGTELIRDNFKYTPYNARRCDIPTSERSILSIMSQEENGNVSQSTEYSAADYASENNSTTSSITIEPGQANHIDDGTNTIIDCSFSDSDEEPKGDKEKEKLTTELKSLKRKALEQQDLIGFLRQELYMLKQSINDSFVHI